MKKRILIILGSFVMGGAENMVCELVCHIDRSKYDLQVICVNGKCNSPLENKIEQQGIDVVYLNGITKVNLKSIIKVWKALSAYHPDVIHTHIGGVVFSTPWIICHSVKFIHTVHTSPEKEFDKKTQFILKCLYKLGKGVMVTVSKENQKKTIEYYSLPISKVRMVNNGIDLNKFYKKRHKNFTFVNVGRQDVNKNQILILKAFAELKKEYKNISLILVGDGNQHKKLETYVKKNNLIKDVNMPGMVSNVEDYLAISDVYIQSSFYEGLPLSVLEAMATRLPIIATAVGGITDIVNNNGILIPIDDLQKLIVAMKEMINNKKEYNKMCNESWKNVQDYSVEEMVKKYERIYDEFAK